MHRLETVEPAGAGVDQLQVVSRAPREYELALRYAPVIRFDANEPFLPLVAGYTIVRRRAPSPSFPREIDLKPPGGPAAEFAIEYAIWWDWDISHLYELEHVWVYVDRNGQIVRAEASWHGEYHDMAVEGELPLEDGRLCLFSEPGKHAFAPGEAWLVERAPRTRQSCTRRAGMGGVHVTPLFKGRLDAKTPLADRLVHTYLEPYSFEPRYTFNQLHALADTVLVPWPALAEWIPKRVAAWVHTLNDEISPAERRPLRIAHRGASAYAPENTLAAITRASEMGADMVELDIHASADGVPVMLHDSNLARTTNGRGWVEQYRVEELKRLDAGDGETIPTLEEAIQRCTRHQLGLYLELKSDRVNDAVVDLLHRYGVEQRTIITSFRPDWIADINRLTDGIATSVLFGAVNMDPVALAQAAGAQYVHPAWEQRAPQPHRLLTETWIERVRKAGLGIISWHEERPAEITALDRLGVDGICSDTPDRLARL